MTNGVGGIVCTMPVAHLSRACSPTQGLFSRLPPAVMMIPCGDPCCNDLLVVNSHGPTPSPYHDPPAAPRPRRMSQPAAPQTRLQEALGSIPLCTTLVTVLCVLLHAGIFLLGWDLNRFTIAAGPVFYAGQVRPTSLHLDVVTSLWGGNGPSVTLTILLYMIQMGVMACMGGFEDV
jgi:hypothetical protein